ncbi:MAG: HAMP domain-containing sensor histidine kinase [Miniphocaeibacter sp.]|uniref:sensor histidine kinase n=1 Tax=Miniphocaeibacter sp. TaxID=3100973 RepID=UPI0017CD1117|nr:HAMP domain-containing histidine kinase [Gallicola sp.]
MQNNFVIIILLIISFSSICYGIIENKKSKKILKTTLQTIDYAINGQEQDLEFDESMNSAIAERLNKMVYIYTNNKEASKVEKNKIKTLISDISHQVRNPLTGIMMYSDLLKETKLNEKQVKMANQIYKQSEKMEFFIKELVKTSYLETDLISVEIEKCPIDELVYQSCQGIEIKALKKKIIIHYKDTREEAFFDMKWTKEALINILENAIKYSPEKSNIYIDVIPYESFLSINIRDEGIGILEEEQGAIFQRFYRSSQVSQKEGFGIGLYLSREIIRKQKGYIKVFSEKDKGSIFSIFLLRDNK